MNTTADNVEHTYSVRKATPTFVYSTL